MRTFRSLLPAFHLGWFLAAVNLALWAVSFADKEPWSPAAVSATYGNPPGWDTPVFIAARPLQVPPLETPLTGVLMTLNIPTLFVSIPFAFLLHRATPVSSLHTLSYAYAAVLACIATAQWLFVGRLLTWSVQKALAKLRPAT